MFVWGGVKMNKQLLWSLNLLGILGYVVLSIVLPWSLIVRVYLFILVCSFYYTIDQISKLLNTRRGWIRRILLGLSIVLFSQTFWSENNQVAIYLMLFIIFCTVTYALFFKSEAS